MAPDVILYKDYCDEFCLKLEGGVESAFPFVLVHMNRRVGFDYNRNGELKCFDLVHMNHRIANLTRSHQAW